MSVHIIAHRTPPTHAVPVSGNEGLENISEQTAACRQSTSADMVGLEKAPSHALNI